MKDSSMIEIIYDYFTSRILFGYYTQGDSLPSSSFICGQFQVSIPTVRAAFARMRDEGYISTSERRRATVTYRMSEQSQQDYISSFLSRREGTRDICESAGILFGPIASAYFQKQDGASIRKIKKKIRSAAGCPARQVILFYAEAMQPLNNPLALNLYWEVVRYLRIPYLKQPTNFDMADSVSAAHIRHMLDSLENRAPYEAAREMRVFNSKVLHEFFHELEITFEKEGQISQIPFQWQIYREHPQLCYTLAAGIMDRIDRQIYRQAEFLPSCRILADEYGVPFITMRRTLKLLGDMRVTETINGVGTRVIAGEGTSLPDFSQVQIRKSLILFLQALQLLALTCESAGIHTLASLDETKQSILEDMIQNLINKRQVFLLAGSCIQFIGENSPSAFVKEVYLQLCQLLLWGNALHVLFHKANRCYYDDVYAVCLLEKLRLRDWEGFAGILSRVLSKGVASSRSLLIENGFEADALV